MRRLILLCLLSALLGGLAAFGLHNPPLTVAQSTGQEGTPWPGQAVPAAPQPGAAPAPISGTVSPQDLLTPDEQVNVIVYQQANRAVVNINTKGVSGDRSDVRDRLGGGRQRHRHRPRWATC